MFGRLVRPQAKTIIQMTGITMTRATITAWLVLIALLRAGAINLDAAEAPPITSEYFGVLRSGDVTKLTRALADGASPNARDAAGNTPLMHAAVYGGTAAMALLIERGADVNATNAQGATPLLRAAFDGQKLALLLDHGAVASGRSALGNTALMLAARPANSHRAVELLLTRGADPNATNNWGATALMAAAAGGDAKSVQLLLARGADPNAQPAADPVGFILGGGRSALMWAAYRGDIRIMNQLIKAGADVNGCGLLGTPLSQAAWSDQTPAAQLLVQHGAKADLPGPMDGYNALHWAASSEYADPVMVNLLLSHGADPNLGGGEQVDAFMGTLQTPLMLARRRGETPIVAALIKAGATNATPDRVLAIKEPNELPEQLDAPVIRAAIGRALPPLQRTSIESKEAFVHHASHQDCISCHQQFLPMAALGLAKKQRAAVDAEAERQLVAMVREGDLKDVEADWQALFHPEPCHSKGYALFGFEAEGLSWTEKSDSWVHHLSVIQGPDGQWHNNLPRPPIQTDDIGATALVVHALQRYPLPGRKAEFAERVDRARRWLWKAKPATNEGRVYQILGLAWCGEPASKLQPLAKALLECQRSDGGWAQLPGLTSDAYATGQALYALGVGAAVERTHRAVEHGLRFLLNTQLEDGTWHVPRRAFPFQPTMNSGFPHGRDSWISAAASSWAVMALSLSEPAEVAVQP
jgi:ankyrin repeat protein